MNRREVITVLGGAAAALPSVTLAQEVGRTYRLGFLNPAPRESVAVAALFDELRLNGFIEGKNLTVIPEGFEIRNEQVAERAAELVKAAPDAILAGPELPLRALQALTRTVPLVGMTEDMLAAGLVTSLARPGGNITGISLLSPELDGKRQDILHEARTPTSQEAIFRHYRRRHNGAALSYRLLVLLDRRRLSPRSTARRQQVLKQSTSWQARCSPCRGLATTSL